MDADVGNRFRRDLVLAQEKVHAGVTAQRSDAADREWDRWTAYCDELGVHPLLEELQDPIPLLQVYGQRYRTGQHSASGHPVRSRTVEDSLRNVGQTFTSLGSDDPRLTRQGQIDFRLRRQLKAYTKEDPPPDRVKPVPRTVIQHIMAIAVAGNDPGVKAIADMIAIAFFYLLRPREYTASKSETTPFALRDVQLSSGNRRLCQATATDQALLSATFASYTFTTQKNGVRGEVIGLGRSGNPHLCPVLCSARRIIHLRQHGGRLDAPLARYFQRGKWHNVTPTDISKALKTAVATLGPAALGFLPSDVSARSLRASGAMALLCARVDTDIIRLLGRWRSDEMLRYLHVQAEPIMRDFASRMLQQGNFVLHPNQLVPTI